MKTAVITENYYGHKLKFPAIISENGEWLNSRKGISKGRKIGKGYFAFNFTTVEGKRENVYVHRTVFCAFNGSLDKNLEIDHINRNRADNRLSNLRQVTVSENRINSRKAKAQTEKEGFYIRALRKFEALPYKAIAKQFEKTVGRKIELLQVYRICKGVSRKRENNVWLSLSEKEQKSFLKF